MAICPVRSGTGGQALSPSRRRLDNHHQPCRHAPDGGFNPWVWVVGGAIGLVIFVIFIIIVVVQLDDPMRDWSYRTGYNDALDGGAEAMRLYPGGSAQVICGYELEFAKLSSDQSNVDAQKFTDGCMAGMAHLGYK